MMGDEAGEGSDLCKHAHFVDLRHNSVQHLAFEWPEHNRLVFNRVHDESLAGLYNAALDVVYGGHGNHEPVLPGTRPLHFRVQLLLDRVHQLRPKVPGMQQNLVFQRYLK